MTHASENGDLHIFCCILKKNKKGDEMGVKAISFSMMSDQCYHASFSLLFSSLFHLHFLCSITMGWHATIETQKLSL